MKHTPATPLRLLTADEVRRWPATEGGYFLAVTDPEHAARLFNRDKAYPRLVEALRAEMAADSMEHNDAVDVRSKSIRLLRELGEGA